MSAEEIPVEKRLFFGWWVVLASIVGLALGYSAIGVFTFGTFVKPLESEFGWSRAQVATGLTVATLTSVVMSPIVGRYMMFVGRPPSSRMGSGSSNMCRA